MSKGKGVSSKTHTRAQMNNYANQHNPNNPAYRAGNNNHSNQCNPNNTKTKSTKRWIDYPEFTHESYYEDND